MAIFVEADVSIVDMLHTDCYICNLYHLGWASLGLLSTDG